MSTISNAGKLAGIRAVLRAHDSDSLTALVILVYLAEKQDEPAVMFDLAKANGMTASGVSLPAASLERGGLIERYCDETDRRKTCVRLTDKGRHVANSLVEVLNAN
jgi:DNA-binding MarR family transcriptional regulator